MRFIKIVDDRKIIIDCDNINLFSLYKREGFVEEEANETELEELRNQAKELGVKGFQLMKKETLITKIAELEK